MKNKIKYLFTHSRQHIINALYNKAANRFRFQGSSLEPRLIQIEPTNRCNRRCIYCSRTNHFLTKEKSLDEGILTIDKFIKIIDQFEYLDYVILQGLGEPFLNPDIFDMIKYAKGKNISIGISTNMSLLNEDMCRKLIFSNMNYSDNITVSINSFGAESFEKTRPSINFTRIVTNLNVFKEIRMGKIYTSFHLVVTNDSIDYLEDYIRIADFFGIKQVSFSDQNFSCTGYNKDRLQIKNPTKLRMLVSKAAKTANKKHIRLAYYKLDSCVWPSRETMHPCWFPWSLPYITWDGFVTPCCTRPYPKEFNFGNVFETRFRNIWNGKQYCEFRKSFKVRKFPDICGGCPHRIS